MSEVLARMQQVLGEILDEEDVTLTDDMKLMDPRLASWDSLANVSFLLALEKEFSTEFSAAEIDGFSTIQTLRIRLEK